MDYLLTYNTFDLNSTIKNRVLDIDSMLSTVFPTISYDIFGTNKNSNILDVLNYMKDQSYMIDNKNISKDSLLSLLRVNYSCIYSDRILDYNKFIIDDNFKYDITYCFDDNVAEYRTYKETYWGNTYEYPIYQKPYNYNYDAKLNSIYTNIILSGIVGMDELIVEKIESHLFEYGYKFQNNTYTKDDHNIQISSEINNITITTTFN